MKSFLVILFVLINASVLFSQQTTISGFILDERNDSCIANASVKIKDTKIAASTDSKGFFSVKVSGFPVILNISHVSYETREVTVSTVKEQYQTIRLRLKVHQIKEITITSKKAVNLLAKKFFDVSDYDFTETISCSSLIAIRKKSIPGCS
jgi:zona occludens toxin (predicted ATPase)